jgi:hypothetical protein
VVALLQHDDLGEFIQTTGTSSDGGPGGDAAHDNEFHALMIRHIRLGVSVPRGDGTAEPLARMV